MLTSHSLGSASLAGLLFAIMFTAPMAIISFKSTHQNSQTMLTLVAKVSPFLTAFLIYSIAVIF